MIVLGLPVGLVLGFLLEYRNFNIGTAIRSLITPGPKNDLRAYVAVIVVNMVGVHLLASLGVVSPAAAPFFWPAMLVGGFLFGLGLSFGAGCTNVWHGTGTGASGLALALFAFMLGTQLIRTPLFSPVFTLLRRPIIETGGQSATLYTALAPQSPLLGWVLVAIIAAGAAAWLWFSSRRDWRSDRSWLWTGFFIGLTGIAAWIVARLNGDSYGLSFTRPTLALGRLLFFGDIGGLYWGVVMILSVPIGVFIAARLRRTLSFRIPPIRTLFRLTGSGIVAGLGASLAGGCNVGHGITGFSLLSLGSITATLSSAAAILLFTRIEQVAARRVRLPERETTSSR